MVRCKQCGNLQVAFGTVVMAFTEEQFSDFVATVSGLLHAHRHVACRHQKIIRIPTASTSIMLVFSASEVDALAQMLDEADMELEIEKLFFAGH